MYLGPQFLLPTEIFTFPTGPLSITACASSRHDTWVQVASVQEEEVETYEWSDVWDCILKEQSETEIFGNS